MADLFRQFFWIIFPVFGMAFAAFAVWNEFSRQKKALEVLKVYAEKGVEPPESVVAVLTRASTGHRTASNSNPLAQAAFFGVMALGFAALTAWLAFHAERWVFTAGFAICGFSLAALAASALVQGLTARRSDAP
jgi:hypothetical protein